jgi:phosphate:Na+ symporter
VSSEVVTLLGGGALLVYSIEELSKNVQYLAGSRLRTWINAFAGNRVSGLLLGVFLSLLLSSSGAVTVMLVGLANSRLLTLDQVFSVTLGASLGSTFIVQLFTFRNSDTALVLIAVGVALAGISRSDRSFHAARSLLFLGLMFFAMGLVAHAGELLEQDELFNFTLAYFRDRPIVSFLISAALTSLVQSSAATIAFIMSLMMAKHGTVLQAIPWVLGANLGTTATAFVASLRSGLVGKQAALGNLLVKVVGIAICYPLMEHLAKASVYLANNDLSRGIANSHTLFNVVVAVVFLPFVPLGVRLVRYVMPDKEGAGPFVFQYLDPRSLSSPELAIAQAQREILRLADTVEQMLERSLLLFGKGNQREIESLKAMDQIVDFLNRGIKLFLTKLSQNEMSPEQVQKEFELLLRTNDLENIGDIVDKNILELVRKNIKKGYVFSREGWTEITAFHAKVVELLRITTIYFNSRDRGIFSKVLVLHQQIEDMVIDLTEQHVQRLHRGVKESLDTTSVHLDLLGNLQRIAWLAVNFTKINGSKSEPEPSPAPFP